MSIIDIMVARVVKETGENYASLSQAPLSHLLMLHEYLEIQDFFEDDVNKQVNTK